MDMLTRFEIAKRKILQGDRDSLHMAVEPHSPYSASDWQCAHHRPPQTGNKEDGRVGPFLHLLRHITQRSKCADTAINTVRFSGMRSPLVGNYPWNCVRRRLTKCSRRYQLPLDIRIPEIRTDSFAVDMMLTTVYAAAMMNKPELLPGCPIRGVETIKTILNALPKISVIGHAVNVSAILKTYHKDAETLISWACVHYRGYLTTAAGVCKIPNLPSGTHQFVLANASPKLESAFVSKLPKSNPKTMVLFHGTSLDRLPAILSQGLSKSSFMSCSVRGNDR